MTLRPDQFQEIEQIFDRIVTLPGGRIIFVELKAPGAKPTENQQRDHERRRALGCEVVVIDNIEAIDAFPE